MDDCRDVYFDDNNVYTSTTLEAVQYLSSLNIKWNLFKEEKQNLRKIYQKSNKRKASRTKLLYTLKD